MAYYVNPTWRDIIAEAREDLGDKVIHYILSYHTEVTWGYFRDVCDRTNKRGVNKTKFNEDAYWKYIGIQEVINNPTLLKETENLVINFSGGVEREISLYDFVFVISFFKFIYDDDDYFSFNSTNSKFEINELRSNLNDLIYDGFAREDIVYRHNFPYCNKEMMSSLLNGCYGYMVGSYERNNWTWANYQWKGLNSENGLIQSRLWFEEYWESKGFKIKLMNWNRLPF
jgi:hypothetical protein